MEPSPIGGDAHDPDRSVVSDVALRVRALESLLIEKGYVDPTALDAIVEIYEAKIGPRNGARVVARSWVDTAYRKWLLQDATAAIGSLGYCGRQGEHMVAVENQPGVHNLVVCTLCSCYPLPVLGLPPVWYKSAPYRSRAVIDPREFWLSSASSCRPRRESGSGIRRPRSATWSCRCAPPEPTAGARSGWLGW